ncbi:hypothetical protein B566_EDAN015751 [Ephemera danica]|nr:hypothetical protein B566_EDAN015751 [Ephemera danica]
MVKWNFSYLDGLFFCFMSLSTIGFGDVIRRQQQLEQQQQQSTWFCALYILLGMALTATCFNIVHDEVQAASGASANNAVMPPTVPLSFQAGQRSNAPNPTSPSTGVLGEILSEREGDGEEQTYQEDEA